MKAHGTPVLIGESGSLQLERVWLGKDSYNEGWLQQLIFDHPALLPIAQLEPGFGRPIPIAREIPCGHGSIDNLYLTPDGDIILVECKLWKNPQARREVVGQALDYVSALMSLGYQRFEAVIGKSQGAKSKVLYEIVADAADVLDEQAFIDAVSRNLSRGRMLVLVLGDGIRQEAEALAGLLQSHAGAHFTFALVELATWKDLASGALFAVPNTLAQTVMIERGILVFDAGVPQIQSVPLAKAGQASPKPHSISEELYFEALAKKDTAFPALVRDFLKQLEVLGVEPELKAALNLKSYVPDRDKPVNIGYITKNGRVRTSPVGFTEGAELAKRYNQALATLIGGQVAADDPTGIYLSTDGKAMPLVSDLLPHHADGWLDAIGDLLRQVRAKAQDSIE